MNYIKKYCKKHIRRIRFIIKIIELQDATSKCGHRQLSKPANNIQGNRKRPTQQANPGRGAQSG